MTIAWLSVGCILGGALLGMALGRVVPAGHRGSDRKPTSR